MSPSALYLHALLRSCGGEPSALKKIVAREPDIEATWRARGGTENELEGEAQSLANQSISLVARDDPAYPVLLKEIHEPPLLLYVRGSLLHESRLPIAIVGTRKPTDYGARVARTFAGELCNSGCAIISGCAYGIDEAAHRAVVEEKGIGIAVIGSGLDEQSFYPRSNWQLAQSLATLGGAVISEYPPGTEARQHHFPERNRIIVGLSKGILFVEAMEKSGTQITARLAAEENRDVFAIPGSIYSAASLGPNRLIKEGATPALSPADILTAYGIEETVSDQKNALTSDLERMLCELLKEPLPLDELKRRAAVDITALQATLSLLELRGVIAEIEHGTYALLHRSS